MGFSIRIDTTNRNKKTKEMNSKVLVCGKEGFRLNDKRDGLTKNPRPEVRTGCEARFSFKRNRHNGKFVVYEFKEQHNHPLVRPECSHMLPSQRKISTAQAHEVELAEESGIALGSAFELMGRQVGGRESLGFTKTNQKNYLASKRQRDLVKGEAGIIFKYFRKCTSKNSSFFHAVQLDSGEQVANIFWADARMIIDYGQFGDVVSFDTTYKLNRESRPFAVFVGLNHHRETVVFGAALLYDETADSFVWLFKTFLKAMSKKAPKTMFTDQDPAMAKAIAKVMPNTYHRLCVWHLEQNALKNVNHLFIGPGGVMRVLNKFLHVIEDENEFLEAWNTMLDDYGARDNHWLAQTFGVKEKWALAYVRHAWSAGMRSTQLSESFNAKLKNYLHSDHDLMQFFKHFNRVLLDKRYKELEAEYDLVQRKPRIAVDVDMLTTAANVYTKNIFQEFQVQFVQSLQLLVKSSADQSGVVVYTIASSKNYKEERHVTKYEDNTLSCNCRLFEIKGILCSHALKVLKDVMQEMELPKKYILKRWTKKARAECVEDLFGHEVQADARVERTQWYRSLCHAFTRISSRACEREETFNLATEKANELFVMVDNILSCRLDGHGSDEDTSPSIACKGNGSETPIQAKGLKKKPPLSNKKKD